MEAIEIKIHNENPRTIGFQPADFIFSIESPAPIKKRVSINNDFEILVIPLVKNSGIGK